MKLDLEYYGSEWLRLKADEVKEFTPEIEQLIDDMIETMEAHRGVGLAATQVGKNARIFITKCPHETERGEWLEGKVKVYVNPKIVERSEEFCCYDDGCLSIPNFYHPTERPHTIKVEALDREGKPFTETLERFYAFNFCHEMDHLNGVLFIDRLDKKTKNKIKPMLQKIKKKYYGK